MSTEETQVLDEAAGKTGDGPTQEQVEAEAREIGWRDKEHYKGDPERWMSAADYLAKSKEFIPFLQASNRDLKAQLAELRRQNDTLARINSAHDAAIKEIQTEVRESNLEDAQTRRRQLIEGIAKARNDNDVVGEIELQERLTETNEEIRAAKKPPEQRTDTRDTSAGARVLESPDYREWLTENEWFKTNSMMAASAVAAMNDLNASGEAQGMTQRQKLDEVARRVKAAFGSSTAARRPATKVEGDRGGTRTTGGGGNGQSYASLPQEAKDACDKFAKKHGLVGKKDGAGNVKYPTIEAWRAAYAQMFHAQG